MPAIAVGLEADLTAALGAFNILTPFSFSFMGEPEIDAGSVPTTPNWTAASAEASSEQLLARAIQASLYDRCYATALATRQRSRRSSPRPRTPISPAASPRQMPVVSAGIPIG
jgi:hypothetical protein